VKPPMTTEVGRTTPLLARLAVDLPNSGTQHQGEGDSHPLAGNRETKITKVAGETTDDD
jgi:hypothetical protein